MQSWIQSWMRKRTEKAKKKSVAMIILHFRGRVTLLNRIPGDVQGPNIRSAKRCYGALLCNPGAANATQADPSPGGDDGMRKKKRAVRAWVQEECWLCLLMPRLGCSRMRSQRSGPTSASMLCDVHAHTIMLAAAGALALEPLTLVLARFSHICSRSSQRSGNLCTQMLAPQHSRQMFFLRMCGCMLDPLHSVQLLPCGHKP